MGTIGTNIDEYVRTVRLGVAAITLINVGYFQAKLADWLGVPEEQWRPRYASLFRRRLRLPILCVHISLPGASILVDASSYEVSKGSSYEIRAYRPPASLLLLMAQAGISPETVTHVVITHGHRDHFNGATIKDDGRYQPSFPNARYYIGRADWEGAAIQEALRNPDSVESRTLGVLYRHGVLDLMEGSRAFGSEVQVTPAPGETPGHQIVRVRSRGRTLYCLGDLYHHPVETEQVAWMAPWADTHSNLVSRDSLAKAASMEEALLIGAHFPSTGRLVRNGPGYTWIETREGAVVQLDHNSFAGGH